MKVLKVQFVNENGSVLSARLTLPANEKPLYFAMFAHCFTCNKDFNIVRNISKAITASGFGVLSLDYTGLGESHGNFAETNFTTNVNDLLAAAGYLTERYISPAVLIGHSFGGPAAIYAASKIPTVIAVATIAAPSEVDHVKHLFKNDVSAIQEEGKATVTIGGNPITIENQFLQDIEQHNLGEVVKQLTKPLLIMHSPQDSTVEIMHAETLYTAAKHPKSFISLDNADHLLQNKTDAFYAGNVIAAWVKRYLPAVSK